MQTRASSNALEDANVDKNKVVKIIPARPGAQSNWTPAQLERGRTVEPVTSEPGYDGRDNGET